jgi:hypothetical protein
VLQAQLSFTTYRVRCIPVRYDRAKITTLLKSRFGLDRDSKFRLESLAQDPYDLKYLVATFDVYLSRDLLPHGKDQFAYELTGNHLTDDGDKNDDDEDTFDILLDSHFRGFTPLHSHDASEYLLE